MKISIHVCNIPCPEEYYMGVSASYEAYDVEIPEDNVPSELQKILKGEEKDKRITGIAIHK